MIIKIDSSHTDIGIAEFEKLMKMTDYNLRFVKATVDYIIKDGIPNPEENALNFPLKLYTDDGIVVCLLPFSAGFGGTGPQGTVKLLKKAGFAFNEEDIYQHRSEVHLKFTK